MGEEWERVAWEKRVAYVRVACVREWRAHHGVRNRLEGLHEGHTQALGVPLREACTRHASIELKALRVGGAAARGWGSIPSAYPSDGARATIVVASPRDPRWVSVHKLGGQAGVSGMGGVG